MVLGTDLKKTAIIQEADLKRRVLPKTLSTGRVNTYTVTDEGIKIEVENNGDGFLVASDSYYPQVRVYVDDVLTSLYETDYAIRGVIVPKGSHVVEFKTALF